MKELLLAQGEEEIALVLARVAAFAEDGAAVCVTLDDGVVAGGDEGCAEAACLAPEVAEFEFLVAHHARVGRAPGLVLGGEVIDDLRLEIGGLLDDVMRDAEGMGDAAGIRDGGGAAAFILRAGDAVLRPDFHGHADDVVALLLEEMGGDGGIDAAGHADDDALGWGGHVERGGYAGMRESRGWTG